MQTLTCSSAASARIATTSSSSANPTPEVGAVLSDAPVAQVDDPAKLYHVHPGIYTVHTPPKTQLNHVSLATSHSHFDHTWHNPQFELTAQLKYLWPNLQLNSKSNPLFKTIQIDLYDPLRIQHEPLPHSN
eukprot:jgi/Chrzof1/12523/Cz06g37090.t1